MYLLNKYGWEYAERFYNLKEKDFKRYNIVKDCLKVPHCKYACDGQCDISCYYFNKKCSYEEILK